MLTDRDKDLKMIGRELSISPKDKTGTDIDIGDIIRLDIGQRIRVWQITGIYLGAEKEENVIGIKSLDMHMGGYEEFLVPKHIIDLVIFNDRRITMPLDGQQRVGGIN